MLPGAPGTRDKVLYRCMATEYGDGGAPFLSRGRAREAPSCNQEPPAGEGTESPPRPRARRNSESRARPGGMPTAGAAAGVGSAGPEHSIQNLGSDSKSPHTHVAQPRGGVRDTSASLRKAERRREPARRRVGGGAGGYTADAAASAKEIWRKKIERLKRIQNK